MDFARKATLLWANFVVQGPTNKRTRPAHGKSSDSTTPLPNSLVLQAINGSRASCVLPTVGVTIPCHTWGKVLECPIILTLARIGYGKNDRGVAFFP